MDSGQNISQQDSIQMHKISCLAKYDPGMINTNAAGCHNVGNVVSQVEFKLHMLKHPRVVLLQWPHAYIPQSFDAAAVPRVL